MAMLLEDLVVDRIDFVDEGANSAAFIEVYKRKEQTKQMDFSEIISKLKPEHAQIIQDELAKARSETEQVTEQLATATEELAKAKEDLEAAKAASCESDEAEKDDEESDASEDDVLKSMPEGARELFIKMREQKEAAEAQVRKNAEEKIEATAIAKAATLKSLPVEQSVLVEVLKKADDNVVAILEAASAALDATVLDEIGKGKPAVVADDAWSKIENKADEIMKRDNVTKQRAVAIAIDEHPELYKEYLEGGTN